MQSKDVLIFIRGEVPRIVSDRYRKWSDPRRMMTSLVLCKLLCFKNNHNAKNISQKMSERSCPHALGRGREKRRNNKGKWETENVRVLCIVVSVYKFAHKRRLPNWISDKIYVNKVCLRVARSLKEIDSLIYRY